MLFAPLSGDAHSAAAAPLAYVLQIDDVKILLDCGSPDWGPESREPGWEAYCSALQEVAPSIDLVLISHGDLAHIGLFAYARARWGLQAPAYSSLPVQALGKLAVTEEIESLRAEQDVDALVPAHDDAAASIPPAPSGIRIPTSKEVNAAFDSLITLRYSQPSHLSGKCQGLTITPYSAGHTLGGTLWKIRSPSSGTILYAVDLNHMKERHLDGTVLIKAGGGSGGSAVFEPLARPDLLITDADRTLITVPRRKDRDAALLETITTTIEDGRSVLIPCDSSARLLELLILLDQHWSFARLRAPMCLMSRTGKEMHSLVRSLVEWMGGTIGKEDIGAADGSGRKRKRDDEDDDMGNLALRFRHLEFVASPNALLQKYPSSKPKLILAVPASLSHGPSRSLFVDFAAVHGNMVIMTSRGEPGTLSRVLFERWYGGQKGNSSKVGEPITERGTKMTISVNSKVPLQGAELEAYQAKEQAAKEREAAQQAALTRNQRMLEADEGDSDSESESGHASDNDDDDDDADAQEVLAGVTAGDDPADWSLLDNTDERTQQLSFDIYLKGNVSRVTSFFRSGVAADGQAGLTRYRMFPMIERKRRVDGYGETLDIGTWMRKGRALEEDKKAAAANVDEGALAGNVEDEFEEPPSKFITEDVNVELHCRLFYVDMEGLNDGRAIKTIVPQVNPRKMIIVHASTEATEALISSCASIRAMTKEIYSPVVGESIAIGQQTNTFAISLSDQLLETLTLARFEDNEVGYVRGRVAMTLDSTIPMLDAALPVSAPTAAIVSPSPGSGSLVIAPRQRSTLPTSTIIGDLKLTILKSRLAAFGITAEFAGEGVLVCNSSSATDEFVAVKKTAKGQVVLEGPASAVYYAVRKEVYGLHAVIAT